MGNGKHLKLLIIREGISFIIKASCVDVSVALAGEGVEEQVRFLAPFLIK
jgi:hypothetical protein